MTAFPGARWWKFDLHTHSPASTDYGKGTANQAALRTLSPSDWLLGFMRGEIDAVAITDHNSGEWIDTLKHALQSLAQRKPEGYRPLTLFPGVEITANGGAHILGVFPPSSGTSDITKLLGAVGAQAALGESDRAATKSPIEVVRAILDAGAIPILAHVDAENSAFSAQGNTLAPLLELLGLDAMEVCKHDWSPPEAYRQRRLTWARVLGSDSHHPAGEAGQRYPGSHFTWVKMETPCLDGLQLALLDGNEVSIRRSDIHSENQNQHSHLVIEDITVANAQYCGRGTPLVAALSPWLTTIIGGRGTGKSTIVQLLRLAVRREDDVPEALKVDFESFNTVPAARGAKGALTPITQVGVVFRKDGLRYRVQWPGSGAVPEIEEERAGAWVRAAGDVRARFPARIFSQGQIFEMARDGRTLLKIVDEAPEVGRTSWWTDWEREEHRFLSLRAKIRELEAQLQERPALEGALSDICRKLAVFEEAEHADVLKAYQRSQRQQRDLDAWVARLNESENVLRKTAVRLTPVEMDTSNFDSESSSDRAILDQVAFSRAEVLALVKRTLILADEARDSTASWIHVVSESEWARQTSGIGDRYSALVAELAIRGVTDVSEYGGLAQERRLLEGRLQALAVLAVTVDGVRAEALSSTKELATRRKRLTSNRITFLSEVLRDNPHVRMTIAPFGRDPRVAEVSLRAVLGLKDGKFADDILSEDGARGCLADLYGDLPVDPEGCVAELERRIERCKATLTAVAAGGNASVGGWFKKHLLQLSADSIDRLQYWFPPDELAVSYSPGGDGRGFRSLEQGSPGQKTAAILAFILAYGTEPIVLDQPEDDLDNQLIYEFIVAQLRANKRRRQVVVVTHNPNIVVNGDSELILVMESGGGQCNLSHHGSLQSLSIRAEVCKIMEGGREALEKRYRRILVGRGDA